VLLYLNVLNNDNFGGQVIVATKVCGYSERSAYIRGKTLRVNEENITASVEESLKRLGTDHIDLLQIHWFDL